MTLVGKVLYKIGLVVAWVTRAMKPLDRRAPRAGRPARPYVFLVTSTINTSQRHLGHDPSLIRSAFTSEERFRQTLDTLRSVRERVPEAWVVLLENSRLTPEQQSALERAYDQVVGFADDARAVALRDGPYKNAAEAYVLLKAQSLLLDCDFRLAFKLSGRYLLSERFSLDRFPADRFGFLKTGPVVSTRLYSVPPNLRAVFERQVHASYLATLLGVSIEDVIARGLRADQVQVVDPIGVRGLIAVDSGAHIDE